MKGVVKALACVSAVAASGALYVLAVLYMAGLCERHEWLRRWSAPFGAAVIVAAGAAGCARAAREGRVQ